MDNADRILNAALATESGAELDELAESVIAIGENHPEPQRAISTLLARYDNTEETSP